MKIYFSSSLRAKTKYLDIFREIYNIIERLGHKSTSNFLLKADPEEYYKVFRTLPDDPSTPPMYIPLYARKYLMQHINFDLNLFQIYKLLYDLTPRTPIPE